MANALTGNITFKMAWDFVNGLDLSDTTDDLDISWGTTVANGTGKDQCDLIFHDQRTLAATSEDFDLTGTEVQAFGGAPLTVDFVKVKGLFIHNTSTTAGENLSIGGAAGTQFVDWVGNANDEVVIGPDGIFALWNPSAAGYAVGAGATDLLKIDSGAATIVYDIVVVGTTA